MTGAVKVKSQALLLAFVLGLVGCQFDYGHYEFKRAVKEEEKGQFKSAVSRFTKVIKRSPEEKEGIEAALRAARITHFQTHEFDRAIHFYKHVVLHSAVPNQRLAAQRNLASIYFDKMGDYQNSLKEYHKLLQVDQNKQRVLNYRYRVSRSYYYMEDFYQALVEIDNLLRENLSKEQRFQYTLFKGNILQTMKKLDKAIEVFSRLASEFPERAKEQRVNIMIAACYEEKKDFKKAIEILEGLKAKTPRPGFLDLKIHRLKQRQQNLPGAKGFRR